MSYVDAWFDRDNDIIKIVERNQKGEREFKNIPVRHTFYYKDPKGKHLSIYGDPVSKVTCKTTKELRKELSKMKYYLRRKNKNKGDIHSIDICDDVDSVGNKDGEDTDVDIEEECHTSAGDREQNGNLFFVGNCKVHCLQMSNGFCYKQKLVLHHRKSPGLSLEKNQNGHTRVRNSNNFPV